MKHKLLSAVAITALLAAPSFAAADDEGWYVRGNVGYGTHVDTDITNDVVGDVESEGNGALSLGLGYDFGNNWRLEADATTLGTDLGTIAQTPATLAKLRTNAYMLNAIYDFDSFNKFSPYVGAGLGIVDTRASISGHDFLDGSTGAFTDTPVCSFGSCDFNDREDELAWQVLAGVGYELSKNLIWDAQYRYLDAGSATFDGTGTNFSNGSPLGGGTAINATFDDVASHTILTGFRYKFGAQEAAVIAPPPPPPPTPVDVTCWDGSSAPSQASCPARPAPQVTCWDNSTAPDAASCPTRPTVTCWDGSIAYDQASCPIQTRSGEAIPSLCGNQYRQEIIYYEFDKGQSPETRATINRILDIGEFCNVDNIRVVGHTDSSGSAAYNLNLSKRRAKDARDELVRQGINSAVITSEGKGETEPFVDRGDGVKEQLNRRTEVLISLSETGGVLN